MCSIAQQKQTISGYVEDAATGEKLIGASIFDVKSKLGTTSNVYGFYSLTLPADSVIIVVRYIGYELYSEKLLLNKNTNINVKLSPGQQLKTVEIVEYKEEKIDPQDILYLIGLSDLHIGNYQKEGY